MKLALDRLAGDSRGVSKVVGSILLVGIVVLLAVSTGGMVLGFGQTLDDVDPVTVKSEEGCAHDRTIEFDGDFSAFASQIDDNPCALWLEAGTLQTDGAGRVRQWTDRAPNGFHATQSDPAQRPELVDAASAPGAIDEPVVRFQNNASLRPGCSPGDGEWSYGCSGGGNSGIRYYDEGDYLRIDRNADQLGVDEDSGMAVAVVVYVERFDRGGTWTIGRAGADGREFSMRTCGADATWVGCGHGAGGPEDYWRAQHWGSADVDFEADSRGEWIVLVHAFDGEETTVRVNGTEIASASTDLDLSENRDVQIGRWERTSGDPSFYLDGAMAELLVFDRAMTEAELEEVEEYFAAKYDGVDV